MSMLVRKGTMLHRNSSRRNSRRTSAAATAAAASAAFSAAGASRRQRSASLAPGVPSTSSTTGIGRLSPSTSSRLSTTTTSDYYNDRRFSRATIAGSVPSSSSYKTRSPSATVGRSVALQQVSSTPSLSAPSNDSRRTSSATSQMSSDDRKRLFNEKRRCLDAENSESTSSGSLTYQLHDASAEANGTCDFLSRALEIIANTVFVTLLLLAFLTLAIFMIIFGLQHLKDCPKEHYVPVYLLIGGCFGGLKVSILLWRQSKLRRYEDLDDSFSEDDDFDSLASSASNKVTDGILTVFLLIWFAFGNYWVFRIYKPRFKPLLLQPSNWCHGDLYTFTLWQIYATHSMLAAFILLILLLMIFRKTGCL